MPCPGQFFAFSPWVMRSSTSLEKIRDIRAKLKALRLHGRVGAWGELMAQDRVAIHQALPIRDNEDSSLNPLQHEKLIQKF
jgi:hypothetical protein